MTDDTNILRQSERWIEVIDPPEINIGITIVPDWVKSSCRGLVIEMVLTTQDCRINKLTFTRTMRDQAANLSSQALEAADWIEQHCFRDYISFPKKFARILHSDTHAIDSHSPAA